MKYSLFFLIQQNDNSFSTSCAMHVASEALSCNQCSDVGEYRVPHGKGFVFGAMV